MKKYALLFALLFSIQAQATYLGDPTTIKGGGTGLSTIPASGKILIGSGTAYALQLLSGDGTMASSGALTIATNAITNAKAAQMAANTFKANNTGSTANAADITVSQANTLLGDILSNGTVSMAASLNMGSNKIVSMLDPTSAQDAATKAYVDSQLAQLNPAASVYAASTANLVGTYVNAVSGICIADTFTITATGAFTVDSTTPPVNSRILFKNQTSSFQDGVWVLTVAGTTGVNPVFTRALDSDSSVDFNSGQIIPVNNGAQAGASFWQKATNVTCNTDSQTWSTFQQPASSYLLAANNLSDLGSASTARTNLGLGTIATKNSPLAVADSTVSTQAISSTAIDWSTGNFFTKTLAANTTFTFTNPLSGQCIGIRITNTASNYTVTFPTTSPVNVCWTGGATTCTGTQPIETIGAHTDVWSFCYDGTQIYGNAIQNY